jgi:hypothetical protein
LSRTHLLLSSILLITGSAFAQNNRSAVASTGVDTNLCTVASPCRSFGAAIAHTNAGGEVIALDSAGYGPFAITFAVTVSGAPGVHAAITASSGDGISVTGATSVTIRNLVLIGTGSSNAAVDVLSANDVSISNCLVRGFASGGIVMYGGNVSVDHCVFVGYLPGAFEIYGSSRAVIADCLVNGSSSAVYTSGSTQVDIVRTTMMNNNTAIDMRTVTGSGSNASMNLKGCTIIGNYYGVAASSISGNTALIYLSDNLIAFNNTAISYSGTGAQVYTLANNSIDQNTTLGSSLNILSFQ